MNSEAVVALLLVVGAAFVLVGSIGLAVLPDFFTRLHGPTKATTLGVGSMLLASIVHFSSRNAGVSLHELLIILFLFITAPVSAHLMSKAALHLNLGSPYFRSGSTSATDKTNR
jgi:multicomponent K+:H+ antiporter subunit G